MEIHSTGFDGSDYRETGDIDLCARRLGHGRLGIVDEKFIEWTAGKSPLEARRSIFSEIQKIPFLIIEQLRDPIEGPQGLLRLGTGSCTPKHFLLWEMLSRLDMEVRLVSQKFFWQELALNYTPALRDLLPELPAEYHLACQIRISDRWALVDATWDADLREAGFPVAEPWDGVSSTRPAVIPREEVFHCTPLERAFYVEEMAADCPPQQTRIRRLFYEKLNQWLLGIRTR